MKICAVMLALLSISPARADEIPADHALIVFSYHDYTECVSMATIATGIFRDNNAHDDAIAAGASSGQCQPQWQIFRKQFTNGLQTGDSLDQSLISLREVAQASAVIDLIEARKQGCGTRRNVRRLVCSEHTTNTH